MATQSRLRQCKRCGKQFSARKGDTQWTNFCSPECIQAHKVAHGHARASRLERDFISGLEAAGLVGIAQYPVGPYVFDIAYPQVRLLVEIDGEAFHTSPAAQERDDRKDEQVMALGWRVQRVPQGIIERYPQQAIELVMDAFLGRT